MEAALTDNVAPLLIVNNIEVVYDHVILVLKGVSLEVPEGGIVALLGANGAGKTTTLKSISNLLMAERGNVTKGSIEFRGECRNGVRKRGPRRFEHVWYWVDVCRERRTGVSQRRAVRPRVVRSWRG